MGKKMKVRKSLLRRVKITGTGKILHRSNFRRHLRRNKSKKQLRQLSGTKEFSRAFANKARKALGI